MEASDFNLLPEDCISMVCSFTSPQDAIRLSTVSPAFQSAAETDFVWERFLPPDYMGILARASSPLKFSSKKHLFFHLCSPILLDGGLKSFALEKSGGRKTYSISERALSILHGNEANHWNWRSMSESRFSEVAELKTVTRLQIKGNLRTTTLSPNTLYGAYLIIKVSKSPFGLDSIPSETSIMMNDRVLSNNIAYLLPKAPTKHLLESLFFKNRLEMLRRRINEGENRFPVERNDGWMEIELGEFFNGEHDKDIKVSLMQIKGQHLKGGLIVEGIEVRPK